MMLTGVVILFGVFLFLKDKKIPSHEIEFAAQESGQSSGMISITLPQGWEFQEKTKKSDTEHEPLMLAGLNPLYTVYDIYDSDHTLIGAIGYSNYEPYEGDKDSVQVVYSALRLGSVYRFDTDSRYDVVRLQYQKEPAGGLFAACCHNLPGKELFHGTKNKTISARYRGRGNAFCSAAAAF